MSHVPEVSVLLRKMKRYYAAFVAACLGFLLGGAVMELSMMATTTTTPNMVTTRDDRYYWNRIIEQDYEWLGDHWIPVTDGVPTYTIDDIISTFGKYNILWMGDSTSRQSYTAVLAMMEVPPRLSGDGNANRYIPILEMEQRKNVNKGGRVDENCTLRNFAKTSVLGTRYNPGTLRCKQSPLGDGKRFDLDSSLACPKDTTQFLELERSGTLTPMLPDYDVVIVQHGIWEVERPLDCRRGLLNNTVEMRLQTSLDSLQSQVIPRSWGTDRNDGDIGPHWGLAARLLGIQMVTHALYVMEEDNKNTLIRTAFLSKVPKEPLGGGGARIDVFHGDESEGFR
ncbi:hypothetical protein ACHAW5_005909 [Stephanodiscus triporus]|uniref:Uncharacterized protein n=1 Tax=Stephanodiscus triporus TaxID=2934178 RepID=A0ABD3NA13_9STRA